MNPSVQQFFAQHDGFMQQPPPPQPQPFPPVQDLPPPFQHGHVPSQFSTNFVPLQVSIKNTKPRGGRGPPPPPAAQGGSSRGGGRGRGSKKSPNQNRRQDSTGRGKPPSSHREGGTKKMAANFPPG